MKLGPVGGGGVNIISYSVGGSQNQMSDFSGDRVNKLASGGYRPQTPLYIHALYIWLPLHLFSLLCVVISQTQTSYLYNNYIIIS